MTRCLTLLLLLAACGKPDALNEGADVADRVRDAAVLPASDAGVLDTSPWDAISLDVGAALDASAGDALLRDLGAPDVPSPDAGRLDSGIRDAAPPDAAADTGPRDSGPPDASPDAGQSFGCGAYPRNCRDREQWMPGLDEHFMLATSACSFGLIPPSEAQWTQGRARAQNLATRLGGAVPLSRLRNDLNRQGRSSITNRNATRLQNHQWQGWIWNEGDNEVSYWYPQGMTGSSDATDSGTHDGRRFQLISWYHKTNARPTKGVRVSLADRTDPLDVDYRHMLLVVPFGEGGAVNYRPLHKSLNDTDALHAGGMAWYGDYLYVADTANGFRVFDMSLIARVSNTNDTSRLGRDGNVSHAFGYRYIVPQVARYDAPEEACNFSFSFVSLDRSSTPHALLAGEYKSSSIQGRLMHFLLDEQTHRLQVREGMIRGQDGKMGAQTKMQGALRWQGNYYISSSSQWNTYGRLYRTRPGRESSISAWVYGAEDLYYERSSGVVWTPAEFPDFRDVVGIPLREP